MVERKSKTRKQKGLRMFDLLEKYNFNYDKLCEFINDLRLIGVITDNEHECIIKHCDCLYDDNEFYQWKTGVDLEKLCEDAMVRMLKKLNHKTQPLSSEDAFALDETINEMKHYGEL